jgi:ferritin-like metal-binding protein YciE
MKDLRDFMVDQLNELRDVEFQIKSNFDKMAVYTSNEELRHIFEIHSKGMEKQTNDLEKVFSKLLIEPDNRHSHVMAGIGQEVQNFIDQHPEPQVMDAGFIAMAQKAKHYEISLYGTIREYAHELNNMEAENLLSEILAKEKQEDEEFTAKARKDINQKASGNTKQN